jgi:hypothetical protein
MSARVKRRNSLSIGHVLCSLLEQTFDFLPERARTRHSRFTDEQVLSGPTLEPIVVVP